MKRYSVVAIHLDVPSTTCEGHRRIDRIDSTVGQGVTIIKRGSLAFLCP